jgi:hypothetical protein
LPQVKKQKSNKRLDNEKENNKSNEGKAVTQSLMLLWSAVKT